MNKCCEFAVYYAAANSRHFILIRRSTSPINSSACPKSTPIFRSLGMSTRSSQIATGNRTDSAGNTTTGGAEPAHVDAVHSPIHSRNPQRVKITPWRLISTAVLLAMAVPQAVASFPAGKSSATTTITNVDWAVGVGWALVSMWVGFVEKESPESASWLFEYDLRFIVGPVIAILVQFLAIVAFTAAAVEIGKRSADAVTDSPWLRMVFGSFIVLLVGLVVVLPIPGLWLIQWLRKVVPSVHTMLPWTNFSLRVFDASDWELNWLLLWSVGTVYGVILTLLLNKVLPLSLIAGITMAAARLTVGWIRMVARWVGLRKVRRR